MAQAQKLPTTNIPGLTLPAQSSDLQANLGVSPTDNTSQFISNIVNPVPSKIPVPQVQTTANAPQIASSTITTPQIPKINIQPTTSQTPILPATQPTFKIDTSNITSDHLANDTTPQSVMNYRNQLQDQYQTYLAQQQPLQQQLVSQTQYSQPYIDALNQTLNTNQGYRAGVQNIRGRAEPLDFQQGQEAALTRDTALQQQANAENLNLQENIRQNNIAALNTGIQNNQQNYQNQFATTQAAQNYGIQAGQLGVSQQQANISAQQANQNRYSYHDIVTSDGPSIQIIDNKTGLPSGVISPLSDQGQQLIKNGLVQGGQQQQGNGIVGGYNISSYATDPNHVPAVNNIYNAINTAVGGQITDTGTAQAVINQLSPNSPVTGQMIANTAQKYSVDPSMLISLMQQDSQMGTTGKGAKTFNPGNVGNTDSGATVNMGSWDKGVDAVGQWLSTHKAQDTAQQQNISPIVQKYINPQGVQGVDGTAYIDESKVSQPELSAVKTLAAREGVPILNETDVSKIKSIDVTKQNLSQMQSTITNILGSGVIGRIGSSIKNIYGSLSQSNPDIASFNNYRTTAINALQGLGAGSGGARITVGEIQAATDNLPLITDNIETANKKLEIVNGFLDRWVKEIIPTAQQGGSNQQINANDPLSLGI